MSWLASSASRAGIHRTLMRRENLADITAKAGSQGTATSLIGTGLGIIVSSFTGASPYDIMPAFLVLTTLHLGSIHRSLQEVTIKTLNVHRLEFLSLEFLRHLESEFRQDDQEAGLASLPTPSQKALTERFVLPRGSVFPYGPVEIGPKLSDFVTSVEELDQIRRLFGSDSKYLLNISEHSEKVKVLLLEGCADDDLIECMLHSSFVRHRMGTSGSAEAIKETSKWPLLEESFKFVKEHGSVFRESVQAAGWNMDHVIVEQTRRRVKLFDSNNNN